jgi:hypothetical protein
MYGSESGCGKKSKVGRKLVQKGKDAIAVIELGEEDNKMLSLGA